MSIEKLYNYVCIDDKEKMMQLLPLSFKPQRTEKSGQMGAGALHRVVYKRWK